MDLSTLTATAAAHVRAGDLVHVPGRRGAFEVREATRMAVGRVDVVVLVSCADSAHGLRADDVVWLV